MQKTIVNSRMNFTLPDADLQFLNELAQVIGCSRSAVVSCLLTHSVAQLSALPSRVRVRQIQALKRLTEGPELLKAVSAAGANINSITLSESKQILRARGPSLGFINAVLDGLLRLAHDTQMSLSL